MKVEKISIESKYEDKETSRKQANLIICEWLDKWKVSKCILPILRTEAAFWKDAEHLILAP